MNIKNDIIEIRKKLNINQWEMADAIGVGRARYQLIEAGRYQLDKNEYVLIRKFLDRKIREIISDLNDIRETLQ